MIIIKRGVQFAIMDCENKEICRFDQLADASIVFRYLNNQSLPESEENNALRLIREFDHRTDRA